MPPVDRTLEYFRQFTIKLTGLDWPKPPIGLKLSFWKRDCFLVDWPTMDLRVCSPIDWETRNFLFEHVLLTS
ncbi:hypothetical protein FRX31_013191 [Thalictrum thalictroides]|uniref:Uncharacterized protein n=1 Tax=Thalictrum thalictroides TaxID=46969 RepID=A0A7J6WIN8_THATH|nr:hypothetical protein FRX31_013191 [Thalictrum thalictroides]